MKVSTGTVYKVGYANNLVVRQDNGGPDILLTGSANNPKGCKLGTRVGVGSALPRKGTNKLFSSQFWPLGEQKMGNITEKREDTPAKAAGLPPGAPAASLAPSPPAAEQPATTLEKRTKNFADRPERSIIRALKKADMTRTDGIVLYDPDESGQGCNFIAMARTDTRSVFNVADAACAMADGQVGTESDISHYRTIIGKWFSTTADFRPQAAVTPKRCGILFIPVKGLVRDGDGGSPWENTLLESCLRHVRF